MILEEKHQKVAIEIVQKNRTKKNCNKCYDRGYIGWTLDKTIIPCEKCVDMEKAMTEWKEYVAKDDALKEDFKELFEEEKTEETLETEETHTTEHTALPPAEKKTVKKTTTPKVDTKKQGQTPTVHRRTSRRSGG